MNLFTVNQFAEKHQAFTAAALRNLIFKAEPRQSSNGEIPGNGMIECGAIVRLGRKVMIDEDKFFEWLHKQQPVAKADPYHKKGSRLTSKQADEMARHCDR